MSDFLLRTATPNDAPLILEMLRDLAIYEKVPENSFCLTQEMVLRDMFGTACHCELAFDGLDPAGIVTWFWTYKSFRGQRGLYGRRSFCETAISRPRTGPPPSDRSCGPGAQRWRAYGMASAGLERAGDRFL
nr:Unknown Function [uncultured bacterium]